MNKKYKEQLDKDNFVKLHNAILFNKDFNSNEKIIISTLISFEINNQKCFYSYTDWSVIISSSEMTAKRIMKKLKKQGLIDWKSGYKTKKQVKANEYKIQDLLYRVLYYDEPIPEIKKSKPKKDTKPTRYKENKKQKKPLASTEPLQEKEPVKKDNNKPIKNNPEPIEPIKFKSANEVFEHIKPTLTDKCEWNSDTFIEYYNKNNKLPRIFKEFFKSAKDWDNYTDIKYQGVDL
jgi:hypothetical protein